MVGVTSVPKDLLRTISGWMGGGTSAAPTPKDLPDLNGSFPDTEARKLFDLKKEALEMASQMALERQYGDREARAAGLDTGPARSPESYKPTMTDYFIAAEKLGRERGLSEQEWNPKIFADLSGQKIDGFQINQSDMQPPKAARMLAGIRAQQTAQAEGRKPTRADTLAALQQIQQSGEKLPSIESMMDAYDLDGDHAISNFYDDIDRHAKFEGTLFANVSFHPAGTLMRDGENGVALTEGASFQNVTFDGMTGNDTLTLKRGQYEDIKLTNIKGGTIEIADGTQIDGMDVRGMHAELHIGRASVSNLDASGARVVRLEAAPGAQITHANFDGATIEMASKLEGSVWKDVSFTGANLVDVEMRGASLSNVRFDDTSLAGLDLSAAKIENLRINGELISDPQKLAEFGIIIDQRTVASISPELNREQKDPVIAPAIPESPDLSRLVAGFGATLRAAEQTVADIKSGIVPTPEATTIAATPEVSGNVMTGFVEPAKTVITFDGEANLADVAISTRVAQMERTVPENEQAQGSMMGPPGSNQA